MRRLLAALAFTVACQNSPPPQADHAPDGAPTVSEGSADAADPALAVEQVTTEPTWVVLDERRRMDLLVNMDQFHLWNEGLFVPFNTPGVRKYSTEYSRPLGDVVEHDGELGRVATRSSLVLQLPVYAPARLTRFMVRAHGVSSGQKLQININGKRIGVQSLGTGWTTLGFDVPAELLVEGENEVRLTWASAGRVGGQKTYGLIAAAAFSDSEGAFDPDTAALRSGEQLSGHAAYELLVEIPHGGILDFELAAAQHVAVTWATDAGTRTLLEGPPPKAGRLQVDLSEFGGQLGALTLRTDGVVRKPVLAMAAKEPVRKMPQYDNVIVMVVDAMRSDKLSIYGNTRVATPHLERLAEHGAVFLHNQQASPSSPPSHASIQTGMIPRVHGVTGDKGKLKPGTKLISTVAGEAGIKTAYVGNNSFGMGRLKEAGRWDHFFQPVFEGRGVDCTAVVDEIVKFAGARAAAGERFFVSGLPFETHAPYRYHEGITEKYHTGEFLPPVGKNADGYLLVDIMAGRKKMNDQQWAQLEALYEGEVEYMDGCMARLSEGLEKLGIAEKTAILLTSDHGEGMNEHGKLGHAYGHYAELANVPFAVFAPGFGAVKVDAVTSVIDVAPTTLALLGIEPPEAMQGDNAMRLALDDAWMPRVLSTEYGRSYSLRSREWRLIVNYDGSQELYHSAKDPKELRNLEGEQSLARRYMRGLSGFFLDGRNDWSEPRDGVWNNFKRRPN